MWFLLTGRIPSLTSSRPALSVFIRDVPVELVNLVEACLDEDPSLRPGAADIARRLRKIAEPEPIDITKTAQEHAIPFLKTSHHFDREATRQRARRRTQQMWASVTLSAVLSAAGVFMILFSGSKPSVSQEEAPPQPEIAVAGAATEDGLVAQLEALAAARDQALMDQDDASLLAVHADDSRSLRQDRSTVAALAQDKLRYEDLSTSLESVTVLELAPAGKARVRAETTTKPFTVRQYDRSSTYDVRDIPTQLVEFSLVKEGERWQISDVALLAEGKDS
jgi:Tfp pilus assembly protein PilN